MNKREVLRRLNIITGTLIDSDTPSHALHAATSEFKEILEGLAGWKSKPHADISDGETCTADGLAVSPGMAAMCLDDFLRTTIFIRGTHAAITHRQELAPDRPLRILYAGCGPFAALTIPLMLVFPSTRVTFTLLDIHPESIESVKTIIEYLELERCVDHIEVTDAASYEFPTQQRPDIILMEIMQSGLDKEPQVAVTRNLLSQAPSAVLIPQEITVTLDFINVSREFDFNPVEVKIPASLRDRIHVGTVFVLNRASAESWQQIEGTQLPSTSLDIPQYDEHRYQAMLCTHIRVFGVHTLSDYDSGLTYPKVISIGDSIKPVGRIEFSYRTGRAPCLVAHSGREAEAMPCHDS